MPEDINEQLIKQLTDVHSIEEQALTQLRRAPGMAGDEALAAAFERHLHETERQESRVRGQLEARGADPSRHIYDLPNGGMRLRMGRKIATEKEEGADQVVGRI